MIIPNLMRISVVIPVFNAAQFVESAVRSALVFDEVKEVLLVEDGSTDESLVVCKQLATKDPRVRLLGHPHGANAGAASSRNLGIRMATGEWIAFLDADDVYLPERFQVERTLLQEHPDADGEYGAIGVHFHDAEGEERYRRTFSRDLLGVRKRVPPEQLFEGMSGGIPDFGHIHLNTLTVRRSCLMAMDILMRPDMRLHQDHEFVIRLSHSARLYPGLLDAPVALRGVHAQNRITRNEQQARTQVVMYDHLWAWSRKQALPVAVQQRFRDQLLAYRIRAAADGHQHRQGDHDGPRPPAAGQLPPRSH